MLLAVATKLKVGTTDELFAVYSPTGKPKSPRVNTADHLGRWSVKWGVPWNAALISLVNQWGERSGHGVAQEVGQGIFWDSAA